MTEPIIPEHPELQSLLNCCEDSASLADYFYFKEGQLFAQYIFGPPVIGSDFAIEVKIYLRDRSLIQILFGDASHSQVVELIAMYMFMSPYIIKSVSWFVKETGICYTARCANAHC